MKTSAMITMAAILAGSAWAGTKSDSQKLVVCIEDGKHGGVETAAAKASSMFLSAGVQLEWHAEAGFCKGNPNAMVVSFMTSTPKAFHPGALAYALPYEGVHIQVFYDRIAQSDPDLAPALMAHVIVHEITHILQGIDRHSTAGIMKAVWTSSDYTQMKRGMLRFTPVDVEMIHDGFAARTARPAAGAWLPTSHRSNMIQTLRTNGHGPLTLATDRGTVPRGPGVRARRARGVSGAGL